MAKIGGLSVDFLSVSCGRLFYKYGMGPRTGHRGTKAPVYMQLIRDHVWARTRDWHKCVVETEASDIQKHWKPRHPISLHAQPLVCLQGTSRVNETLAHYHQQGLGIATAPHSIQLSQPRYCLPSFQTHHCTNAAKTSPDRLFACLRAVLDNLTLA